MFGQMLECVEKAKREGRQDAVREIKGISGAFRLRARREKDKKVAEAFLECAMRIESYAMSQFEPIPEDKSIWSVA